MTIDATAQVQVLSNEFLHSDTAQHSTALGNEAAVTFGLRTDLAHVNSLKQPC